MNVFANQNNVHATLAFNGTVVVRNFAEGGTPISAVLFRALKGMGSGKGTMSIPRIFSGILVWKSHVLVCF